MHSLVQRLTILEEMINDFSIAPIANEGLVTGEDEQDHTKSCIQDDCGNGDYVVYQSKSTLKEFHRIRRQRYALLS